MTQQPQLVREQLIAQMRAYGKPRAAWRVGVELERHLLGPDGMPAPYFGDHGVAWLLDRLVELGWTPKREGEHVIALSRGLANVTLEPGGQVELSGSPFTSLHDVAQEAADFATTLTELLAPTPFRQVTLGYTPFATMAEVPWVPKGRYVVMREHLAVTGPLSHDMMKGTAATQASYDFADEADAAAKVQLAIRVAPIVTALFASSPLRQGKPSGFKSFRGHIWTQTDPARTGFPEAATAFSFTRWVDYLLDVPMMFTRIDGVWAPANGLTFRQWMRDGVDGRFPTEADWDLHQTSVFPEVRVKHVIEARMADCVGTEDAVGFAALFKGLFYGAATSPEAWDLAERFTAVGTQPQRFAVACRDALAGQHSGRPLAAWAEALLDISRAGLERVAPDEVGLLDSLARRAATGRTVADDVLDAGPDGWTAAALRARFGPAAA